MSFLYDLEEHEFAIICIIIISLSLVGIVFWVGPARTVTYAGTVETITSKYTTTGLSCYSTGKTTLCYPVTYFWTDMMVHYNKTKTEAFHESSWQWNKGDNVCVKWTFFNHAINTEGLSEGAC